VIGAVVRAALLGAALVLSSIGAGGDAGAPANGSLPGGGTYLIRPGGGADVAAVALWYRAPAGGFGTDAVPALGRLAASAVAASRPVTGTSLSQFARQIGGRLTINAYPESIAVSLVVPAARASDAVQALTRSYFAPVMTDLGLTLARRSVVEDGAIRSFDSGAVITDAIYATLFASGPAKIPPFGTSSSYANVPIDVVRAFAERAFRPGNALLIVTGAVDSSVVTAALPGREDAPPNAETPAPETLAGVRGPVQARGVEAGFGLGWAGPPISDEREATAFDFIADYLFYPDTGVVQKAVRNTGSSVVGTFVTYHNPGVFLLTASGGDQAAVHAAVDAGLLAIRHPLDAAAFAAARHQFIYHILSDDETASALADTYGWYSVEGNPGYAPGEGGAAGRYLAAANALTPEFVAATAAKYLDRPGAAITISPPPGGLPR
jgi:predicted Zn-dependent peptidase